MTFNANLLIQNISNSILKTSSSEDMVVLAKAIEQLKSGSVYIVVDIAAAQQAVVKSGTLIYVTSEKTLYLRDGSYLRRLSRDSLDTVWAWGCNSGGRLGDGTTVDKSSPVSVVGGFTDWCQISSGRDHTLSVRQNGTLWAWGLGSLGRLGDGTLVNKSSPVSVVGGFTDWCQVSAGGVHTAAVRQNGTLWAWGDNTRGQLGDGTTVQRTSPVSVVGGFTDWCQVSAGNAHTAALRQNGTLWAWGCNGQGQLGDGTIVDKSSPVSVVGGFTDWCQVSAGCVHTAAVRQNGTLWAWGLNQQGILGDGTTVSKSSPVSVVGGFTDWCQVSAGGSHTAAVRQNGTLWSWGCNTCGLLGDGTTVSKSSPVSVVGGFTDWCQVSAGSDQTSAVRQNGTLWAWGCNTGGRLGDGTTVAKSSPVSVVGGFTDWCQVSNTCFSTAAIRKTQII
jgi:alpha-tubulin suppressor-like RCC1 family protein